MCKKTNAMRILDAEGILYQTHSHVPGKTSSGIEVASLLQVSSARLFKTLVSRGKSGTLYVFVIPVEKSLHLKMAASAVGEKSIELVLQRELFPLTGYVHGGCSPIGMKKALPTVLEASALTFETIYFSAGKRGTHIEMKPQDLQNLLKLRVAILCEK